MPRLIESTGERIVPWARDAQVIYEHYHRYLWARPLVTGRRVLDLGSGEGYGAALLAQTASAVTGVDIDEPTVEHARANYPGVDFRAGSAADLAAFADDAFEAVVAFEMIEHVAEHEQVLAEIARVLAPGGLLVMSTPERRAYSDERDFHNPFHARELTQAEFTELLGSHFTAVSLFAQRAIAGSRIDALGEAGWEHASLAIERAGDDWRETGVPEPLYLVAVASRQRSAGASGRVDARRLRARGARGARSGVPRQAGREARADDGGAAPRPARRGVGQLAARSSACAA